MLYPEEEEEIRQIARSAKQSYGALQEVIFLKANETSFLMFANATYPAKTICRYLTFGYSGTGPSFYEGFLSEFGFRRSNVEKVDVPSKLKKDGTIVKGITRKARGNVILSGNSLEEARQSIQIPPGSIVLGEQILSEGGEKERQMTVTALSEEKARALALTELPSQVTLISINIGPEREIVSEKKYERTFWDLPEKQVRQEALQSLPAGAEAMSIDIENKSYPISQNALRTLSVKALSEEKAREQAEFELKLTAACADPPSIVDITCVRKPFEGILGIGKRKGEYNVRYEGREYHVTISYNIREIVRDINLLYREPSRIRVDYVPELLRCRQCGHLMEVTTEGVYPKNSGYVKLRCNNCDITRFEEGWKIQGSWTEWEDGSDRIIYKHLE